MPNVVARPDHYFGAIGVDGCARLNPDSYRDVYPRMCGFEPIVIGSRLWYSSKD